VDRVPLPSATLGRSKDAFRYGRNVHGSKLISNTFVPNIRPGLHRWLTATLNRRIMVIDGAMGTAIQRDRPDERAKPRRPVHRVADGAAGQQRPAEPDPPADHHRHPPGNTYRPARTSGNQTLQRERDLAGRLRVAELAYELN
jgi:hypothetical protein